MSLLDLITGGKSSEASADYEKALGAIQGVNVPTAEELKYRLQQYVQAGVLTPEQAQVYLQDPNALAGMNIDQTGTDAQQKSIAGLLSAAEAGGIDPAEQARVQQIMRELGTREKGSNDAIVQRQAERGALTGGETMAAQLEANQTADMNANQQASDEAGAAYNARLGELTSAGGAGATLQGQQNTQADTVGAATNAINQFNAAEQQQEENMNVTNKNAAQEYNLNELQGITNKNTGDVNEQSKYEAQLPQEIFGDEMQKAAAEAGVSENAAGNATAQGGQEAGLIGGIVGAAGDVGAAYAAPTTGVKTAAEGGSVPGDAEVSGDSPRNDTVPAMLSPGEVVLPRTIAKNPDPDRVMDFLRRMRPVKQSHPDDVATVLHALGKIREVA